LQFEKVKYCEHDFHMLFAPCCGKCGMYACWLLFSVLGATRLLFRDNSLLFLELLS